MKPWFALCVAAVVFVASNVHAESASGLVRVDAAPLYTQPNEASPIIATLPSGAGLMLNAACDAGQEWCNVTARNLNNGDRLVTGWMRTAVMYPSSGIRTYLTSSRVADAASLLRNEIRRAGDDPLVGSWLRFYLSVAQEELDQLGDASQSLRDEASQSLEDVIRLGPQNAFVPFAYLALAKLNLRHGDVAAALGVYERMLSTFPNYAVDFGTCYRTPVVVVFVDVCSGDRLIQKRIDATRTFLRQKADAERVTVSTVASATEKAGAWYSLGQAWEEKIKIDPDRLYETEVPDTTNVRDWYETVIDLAPGSDVAGKAAWRLISFSQPYEWEGDWQGRAGWELDKYGTFIETYPGHELVGEALFKMAVATWAKAGYPEVYHYIIVPEGYGEAWRAKQTLLNQWFDTRGFGGGKGEPIEQHPDQTPAARRMLQDVVTRFPQTPSAAMASYYIAVISDYGLGDAKTALSQYDDFVRQYPSAAPYTDKARQRIALLR
jgi:tetratricopeptide (TPR) repeat protein